MTLHVALRAVSPLCGTQTAPAGICLAASRRGTPSLLGCRFAPVTPPRTWERRKPHDSFPSRCRGASFQEQR